MSVLDASVVLKWFVDEEGSDRALDIRREFIEGKREIAAPDLLIYEMSNVLSLHPGFAENEVILAMHSIWDIGISIVTPTKSLIERTIKLSKQYGITAYDSSYIALAEELGYDFLTADAKLLKKITSKNPSILSVRCSLL